MMGVVVRGLSCHRRGETFKPCRNPRSRSANASGDLGPEVLSLAWPAAARVVSDHAAAAPPSAASNSRRPMVTVIRPLPCEVRKTNDTTPLACSLHVQGGQDAGPSRLRTPPVYLLARCSSQRQVLGEAVGRFRRSSTTPRGSFITGYYRRPWSCEAMYLSCL